MTDRSKPPGIITVAAAAGVSVTTVSHVLSARRPVAAATRQRVLRVIDELGYMPNQLARGLRTQETRTVALVVPDLSNPFYPDMARGLREVLDPAGYLMVVCTTEAGSEHSIVRQLVERRTDAIGFAGTHRSGDDIQAAIAAGVPMVLLGPHERLPGVDTVNSDDFGAGVLATGHLLDQGHERIGFIAGPAELGLSDRLRGYHDAMARAERPVVPSLVHHGAPTRDGGRTGMTALLSRPGPPTAVVCTNDLVAIGALEAARALGRRVPADVAVVGFDDIEAAALVSPALTTVRIPAREQGRACGRLLLHRLGGDDQQPKQVISFAATLVRRESA